MRVLVTRPAAEAERTGAALFAAGHEPILAPVMAIAAIAEGHQALETALDRAPPPAALLITSANALHALASPLVARLAALPVFAVGVGTAAAARAIGCYAVTAAAGDADALAKLVVERCPAGSRLLYLAAEDRRPTLEAALAARYGLETIVVYRAAALAVLPPAVAAAIKAGAVDAALHFSVRSARLFWQAAAGAGVRPEAIRQHVALSPAVAAALHGLIGTADGPRIVAAASPSEAAMIAALD
jgi:uroporphyrinogen-III synthase